MSTQSNQATTTAQLRNAILCRDNQERNLGSLTIIHRVNSIPNGQHYGKTGHIPCDHSVEFTHYDSDGDSVKVEKYDGKKWVRKTFGQTV